MRSQLDSEKALEAIIFTSRGLNGDLYAALKAIYHADKYHLENYGSQIYGEEYGALEHGPVPSFAYNVTRHVRGISNTDEIEDCENYAGSFDNENCSNRVVATLRDADMDYFSKTDIAALEFGIAKCANKTFSTIKNESHDEAYRATSLNSTMAISTIASTLKDGAKLIQHLKRNDVDELDPS